MAAEALKDEFGIFVISSSGLLVDEFLRLGIDVVFRGVRNDVDEGYEEEQKGLNNMVLQGYGDCVEYIPARQELKYVSSSQVKGFVEIGIDVSEFVPLHVKVALEQRIHNLTLIGITGGIATGKSYVAERLASQLGGTHINVDKLVHDLYAEQTHGAKLARQRIAELLGADVLVDDVLDRALMRQRLFGSAQADERRAQLEEITKPHVMRLLRARLKGLRGVAILEWAQLVEMDMMGLVNNRVIVVRVQGDEDARRFLHKRHLRPDQIADVLKVQWSARQKVARLESVIKRDHFGEYLVFTNTPQNIPFEHRMKKMLEQIRKL